MGNTSLGAFLLEYYVEDGVLTPSDYSFSSFTVQRIFNSLNALGFVENSHLFRACEDCVAIVSSETYLNTYGSFREYRIHQTNQKDLYYQEGLGMRNTEFFPGPSVAKVGMPRGMQASTSRSNIEVNLGL